MSIFTQIMRELNINQKLLVKYQLSSYEECFVKTENETNKTAKKIAALKR